MIDKNSECIFVNQFMNKKFIFDNNLLNNEILSKEYLLEKDSIKYHLNLYPSFPLIYSENNSNGVTILGKELYKVKLVKGEKQRGILLSFLSNDNNNELYTHLFIKCDPNSKSKLEFVGNDENNFFFSLNTNNSCPYCLTSEVKYEDVDGKCFNGTKTVNVIINDGSLCVIKNFDKSESSKLVDDDEVLLNKNSEDTIDKLLIENFDISENVPINYEKNYDEIETSFQKEVECKGSKIDEEGISILLVIVIVVVILLVIILIILIVAKVLKNKNKNDDIPELQRESLTELENE